MLLYLIDLFGVAVFAVSGALVAGRRQMDLFGVLVIASVTAIGGGTLRDLLLGRTPVFWTVDAIYIVVIALAALGTVLYARFDTPPERALVVADAFGLAFFAISGARTAEQLIASPLIITLLGTMTGVAGGVLRDVLTARVPLILERDIYATAAIAGIVLYLLLGAIGVPIAVAAVLGMIAIFALRLLAIFRRFELPRFRLPQQGA